MDDRAERKRGEFLMATYLTDSSDLTSVANAIRIKGGTSAQMAFPAGFVSAVQAIPTGTTPTGTKSISITQNGTTTEDVTNYASAEITVDVQGGGGDLDFQAALISGVFDKDYTIPGTTIGRAFANCTGNVSLIFPDVTTLRVTNYTFENSVFSSISFPKLTGNVGAAFHGFKGSHIYANQITAVGNEAFASCSNLKDAFFPLLTTTSTNCFNSCSSLTVGVFGNIGSAYYQFRNCSKLESVDFIGEFQNNKVDNSFDGCTVLSVVVLRSTDLIPLTNLSAFQNTPFASNGSGGTLYVPSALISTYQSATNWSTILGYANNQILPIEGSIYETQYADGTPIT